MEKFIKTQIARQGDISEELGKAKYCAYFVNTKLYERYRVVTEELLIADGYEFCIVQEEVIEE